MATQRYYLGIDSGGTLSKAALYDAAGKELFHAARKTTLLMPHPGFTERNMEEMWTATADAIKEVVQSSGVDPCYIAAVAATGHGNGLYLLDAEGKPSRPGIISTDSRALSYVDMWEKTGVLDMVLPKTMQSVWAGSAVSLLAWLADNESETIKRSAHILMAKDYIRYRLTGVIAAEMTDMSGTNLLNVRDARYDESLLQAFGLSWAMKLLPPLMHSTEICGRVTAIAAATTGLAEGTLVAGGLFDIDASAIATGVVDATHMSVVAGTWSINQFISQTPIVKKGLFMTSLYCMDGWWLICEGSPTSASNLEWFVTQVIGDDYLHAGGETAKGNKSSGEQAHTSGKQAELFKHVDELVAQTKSTDANIVFLPFIFGSNVVVDAKCAFVGLCGWHTNSHLLRAIHEGIVFGHRSHIERLAAAGDLPRTVRIAGGATKSGLWMQMFADILQMPIEVTTSTELGTLGAAMCARVACGDSPSLLEASNAMVKVASRYESDPAQKKIYDRKYENYLATIETLAPLWKRLV